MVESIIVVSPSFAIPNALRQYCCHLEMCTVLQSKARDVFPTLSVSTGAVSGVSRSIKSPGSLSWVCGRSR